MAVIVSNLNNAAASVAFGEVTSDGFGVLVGAQGGPMVLTKELLGEVICGEMRAFSPAGTTLGIVEVSGE